MKNIIKKIVRIIYIIMTKCLPVRKNVIVFNSNIGRNYTGNPRAIYEALIGDSRFDKYIKIWFFNGEFLASKAFAEYNKVLLADKKTKVVRYGYLKYHYYMAVARIWIFDGRQESYLKKRNNQFYLQCWHGTPLKKLALDMEVFNMSNENDIESYKQSFIKESATWDALISQNRFSTETFKRCFGYDGKILEAGYPRNDILVNNKNNIDYLNKLKEKFNVPKDKKVILYAPTWRDDKTNQDGTYSFETDIDFTRLSEKLNGDCIFLIKEHYLVKNKKSSINGRINKSVLIFDFTVDINELYLISDILITDYSSVMFDYSNLSRPIVLYLYDYEHYRDNLRGFYFDITANPPGPIARNIDELENILLSDLSETCNQKGFREFKDKFNALDDGKATARVLDLINY